MAVSRRRFLKGATAAALFSEIGLIRAAAAESIPEIPDTVGRDLADQYTLDPAITYLNHGSIGTIPRVVQDAHVGYLTLCETNPWLYMWSQPWVEPIEAVRGKAAALIGCDAEELSIMHNTTECFNLLAQGLPIGPGDEVLFSTLNHSGASVGWTNQSTRRGYTVRRFDFPVGDVGTLSVSDLVDLYVDAVQDNTRVVVFPHVDNTVGLRHPVAEITAALRDKGVRWVVVDGAQTASMIPVDVHAMGVDVYATSAHKWIQSPKELGVSYIRKSIQDQITPMWTTWGQNSYRGTVRIFEDYGTRALASVVALGDALDFQAAIDPSVRYEHHRELWTRMREIVGADNKLFWRSSTSWELSAALYAIEVDGKNGSELARQLFRDHGIVVRGFASDHLNGIRVSPNVANTEEDLAALLGAIKGLL